MFKLIFRTIVILLFLVFFTIALAAWKGGDPFRTFGAGVENIGKKISEFGDFVDDVIRGGKELKENYTKFKEVIDNDKKD
jgi:hypothetical protein